MYPQTLNRHVGSRVGAGGKQGEQGLASPAAFARTALQALCGPDSTRQFQSAPTALIISDTGSG